MSFFRKHKEKILVGSISIFLLILIGVTNKDRLELSRFEKALGGALAPGAKFFNKIGEGGASYIDNIKNISSLREENEELKKRVLVLEDENRKYQDTISKKDYLKNQLDLIEKTEYKIIESEVIAKEPDSWFDRFVIDKGDKNGLKAGDTVVNAVRLEEGHVVEGLVGRVVETFPNSSKIITIVDEDSKVAFKVLRTQDGGVIEGSLKNNITGYLFDNKADVIKGDLIYTSGLGGLYEKDLFIGEISEVINDEENMMKTIVVKPAIDFKKLYKVSVIKKED